MLQELAISIPSLSHFSPQIPATEEDPRLLSALRFIDNNYSQPSLGLKDISQSVGLSVWYFSRIFNARMRMGFREYLRCIRMRHACRLLRSSSLSIKEIAANVGYTHLSDFYHHFKSGYGISPLVFRRSLQLNDMPQEAFHDERVMQSSSTPYGLGAQAEYNVLVAGEMR